MRLFPLAAVFGLGALMGVGLSACSDDAPRTSERQTTQGEAAPHKAKWLELSSPLSPAQWLVSRGEAKPKPVSDPEVQRVSGVLANAHTRYRESERMIANRSVQLSDMLQQIGLTESAIDVLDDLANIGGEVGQTEGFGAISQYYFNLRAASVARADALATLKTRYGSKS